jgi:hypothetical protein
MTSRETTPDNLVDLLNAPISSIERPWPPSAWVRTNAGGVYFSIGPTLDSLDPVVFTEAVAGVPVNIVVYKNMGKNSGEQDKDHYRVEVYDENESCDRDGFGINPKTTYRITPQEGWKPLEKPHRDRPYARAVEKRGDLFYVVDISPW